uniref:Uncharacterized protein n=1 Tax=Siphoviridae sp. ctgaY24 TaxID=2827911 RepID=A0A8S5SAQ7_9CAUD|nr:MAG TPA: hypothetical protein [Siphoviridae sp. ctgaY24]
MLQYSLLYTICCVCKLYNCNLGYLCILPIVT